MQYVTVTPDEFDGLDGLDDWRYVLGAIRAVYRCASFGRAAELARDIASAADDADHHPDLDLRPPDRLQVTLVTHAVRRLTDRDVELARTISALAAAVGAASSPDEPQALEVALDTMDAERIRPFWAAVLAYDDVDGALVDPRRIGPPMWFQQMDEPRTDRGRFHLDISVPHDLAEQRVASAVAAGGRIVTAEHARSWWVLADADGNEACVSTWQDR